MKTSTFNKYFKTTENFRIENPNPRWAKMKGMKWNTGDCVIRAVANATACTWLEAFDFLTAKARRDFSVYNDGPSLRKWLIENGAVWTHCPAVKGEKRMTCLDFAKSHPTGRYVISIACHETACVDGVLLDAWNPGESAVVGYFDMSNFTL